MTKIRVTCLVHKYHNATLSSMQLTDAEQQWLDERDRVLRLGLLDGNMPYSDRGSIRKLTFMFPGLRAYPAQQRQVGRMTLGELKAKDVVNTLDGRCIGKPMDLEFDSLDGRVTALVVPGEFRFWDLLRGEKCGVVIPWGNICKIGDDVILVDLTGIV